MADDIRDDARPTAEECARLISALRRLPVAVAVIGEDGRVTTADGGLRGLIGNLAPSAHPEWRDSWQVHDEAGESLTPGDWPDACAMRGEAAAALAFAPVAGEGGERLPVRFSAAPLSEAESEARVVILLQEASTERDAIERFGAGLRDMCVTAAADAIRRVSVWPMPGAGPVPAHAHRAAAKGASPDGGLTPREAEVLRLIAWGHSHKDVGDQLGIAARTVEFHRSSAARKLDLRGRADIVRFALDRGWLQG